MKYFRKEEFLCRCGKCEMPAEVEANIVALVENVLDPAREKFGKPIIVNSGYRCPKHNTAVGGVANSQHTRGEAADITSADNEQLAKIIEENARFDQLIYYPSSVRGQVPGRTESRPSSVRGQVPGSTHPARYLSPDREVSCQSYRFLHVSYKRQGGNRHQVLMKTGGGYIAVKR